MTKPEELQGGQGPDAGLKMRSETLYLRTQRVLAGTMHLFGLSVEGRENVGLLEKGKGTEVIPTHDSFFDVAGIADLGLMLRLVGKRELKRQIPPLGFLGDRVGVEWVDRGDAGSRAAVQEKTVQLLDAGEVVGSFGAGTRNKSGDRRAVGDLKTGPVRAAYMAQGDTDILLVGIGYHKGLIRKNSPFHMGMVIGEPIIIPHNPDFTEVEMRETTAELQESLAVLKIRAVDLAEGA